MDKHENVPVETLAERPKVFTEESFAPVQKFAARLLRLQVPTSPEEVTSYEQKFRKPAAEISPEEIRELKSPGKMSRLVDEKSGVVIREQVSQILNELGYNEEDRELLTEAAATRIFDDLAEIEDKEKCREAITTALGLTLVAERARANTTINILRNLPEETLANFHMTGKERDILCPLIKLITKVNAEYLRHNARLTQKIPYSDVALGDQARERNFLSRGFGEIIESVRGLGKDGQEPVFGSAEKDQAFLKYLTDLQGAYAPFVEDTTKPISAESQQELLTKAQESFLALHNQFPDFPLFVFPAFSHYESDEVAGEEGKDWTAYGFDPEIRLHWQGQEQQNKREEYDGLKNKFVPLIEERCGGLVNTDFVRNYKVFSGDTIVTSGVNMRGQTEAQGEGNVILIIEAEADEKEERRLDDILKSLLANPEDQAMIDSAAFKDLTDKTNAFHELTHGLYDEKSEAAEKLGDLDDKLAELKSELAMWSTAVTILRRETEKTFGTKADQAVMLSMLRSAFRYCRKERSEPEYYFADKHIVEMLISAGVIDTADGQVKLREETLNGGLENVFTEELRKMLAIYQTAEQGRVREAKQQAKYFTGAKPSAPFKQVKKFIK